MTRTHALLALLAVAHSSGCAIRQDYLIRKQHSAVLQTLTSEEAANVTIAAERLGSFPSPLVYLDAAAIERTAGDSSAALGGCTTVRTRVTSPRKAVAVVFGVTGALLASGGIALGVFAANSTCPESANFCLNDAKGGVFLGSFLVIPALGHLAVSLSTGLSRAREFPAERRPITSAGGDGRLHCERTQ